MAGAQVTGPVGHSVRNARAISAHSVPARRSPWSASSYQTYDSQGFALRRRYSLASKWPWHRLWIDAEVIPPYVSDATDYGYRTQRRKFDVRRSACPSAFAASSTTRTPGHVRSETSERSVRPRDEPVVRTRSVWTDRERSRGGVQASPQSRRPLPAKPGMSPLRGVSHGPLRGCMPDVSQTACQ